jgi:hypothetical protein
MSLAFWTDERVAGSLLAGSLPIIALALIILIASGALPVSSAYLQGDFAKAAPYTATFRLLFLLSALGWIVQTLGFGLFARLLLRAGHGQLAVLAFTLALVAATFVVLWATFRMSVELWAAGEAARIGSMPAIFEPLQAWTNSFFGVAERAHFLATAGFGWGTVRTGLLAPGLGWSVIGWSLLMLLAGLGGGLPPATPIIMPAVMGIALLLR